MRHWRPAFPLGSFALAVLLCASCDNRRVSPLASIPRPTPVDPSLANTIRNLLILGNGSFTALGETHQFIASATFNDGRSKDVTADGRWRSTNTEVAVVSAPGEVKIVGFGPATILFEFEQQLATVNIRAASPNSFTLKGRVREPGAGDLAGVTVVDTMSGRSSVSDSFGQFEIFELFAQRIRLRAEKDGYETRVIEASPTSSLDLPMQRIVRLVAGETVKPSVLAPNDVEYVIGQQACVCRLIRILVPRAGTVAIRVSWLQTIIPTLHLFSDGPAVSGSAVLTTELPVTSARELVVHFGKLVSERNDYVEFTVETTLR